MHSSVYFCKCAHSEQFKFNAVNGQSPENQHGQRSNAKKGGQIVLTLQSQL